MKVTAAITEHKGRLLSVEIEPPLLGKTREESLNLLESLVELGVAYVDITYHAQKVVSYAGGRPIYARAKPGTLGIAGAILGHFGGKVMPVPHVICTNFSKYDAEEYLVDLSYLGKETRSRRSLSSLRKRQMPAQIILSPRCSLMRQYMRALQNRH